MSLVVSADPEEDGEEVDNPNNDNQLEVMENSDEQMPKESYEEMDTNDDDFTENQSDEESNDGETNDVAESENDEGKFNLSFLHFCCAMSKDVST